MATFSCVCWISRAESRLPASCTQRSLKSKVHRGTKQARRDGSREHERQITRAPEALWSFCVYRWERTLDSHCLHFRRCYIVCYMYLGDAILLSCCSFFYVRELKFASKQACLVSMLPHSSVVQILFLSLFYFFLLSRSLV